MSELTAREKKNKRDNESRRQRRAANPEKFRVGGRALADVFGCGPDGVEAAFWARVNKDGPIPAACPERGPCWLWTGDHKTGGYGLLRKVGAHRVAMWIDTGEEPAGRHTLHYCDNPPCVRRSHLHFGTHAENMQEKVERGRASRPGLKFSDDQVEEIRRQYAAGATAKQLAASFGISSQQAGRIAAGTTRKLQPVETEFRKKGLRSRRQKLTAAQHDEVRARIAAGERPTDVAKAFGIYPASVSEIVHGRVRNKNPQPRVVLSSEQVRDLRAKYANGGVRIVDLGAEYGIHHSQVSRIINRRSHSAVA